MDDQMEHNALCDKVSQLICFVVYCEFLDLAFYI